MSGLADTGFVGVGEGAGLVLRSVSILRVPFSFLQALLAWGEAGPSESGQTPRPQDTLAQFFNLISHQSLSVSAETASPPHGKPAEEAMKYGKSRAQQCWQGSLRS